MGVSWKLPPIVINDGVAGQWSVVDGRLTHDKATGASQLPGRCWSIGLVDAHVHLALRDRRPLDRTDALTNLRAIAEQGVTLVRDMGAPGSITLDLELDDAMPRLIASGRQLAVAGGFFPGCFVPVPPEQLVDAALGEVARGATWVKILTDWTGTELTYPVDILRATVLAVHAAGARVAAHNQRAGLRDVVLAGVDSIEHGTAMDAEVLALLAERDVAWVPTTCAIENGLRRTIEALESGDLAPERRLAIEAWLPVAQGFVTTISTMLPMAASMGVRLLASTDNAGSVAEDVANLVRYGVDPAFAVAAATTSPRDFLGAPSLNNGAPADVVTFDEDPRLVPSTLRSPVAVLVGGTRVR